MNIREEFKDHVSKSAFKVVDGVTRIIGKYGEIEIVGNSFDVYFVGPERTPLSTKRINSAKEKLRYLVDIHVLNGEAFYQTDKKEIVLKSLDLLGVRKKRQISDTEKERLQRMCLARADCGNDEG